LTVDLNLARAREEWDKIDACGTTVRPHKHKDCGAIVAVRYTCDSRWCPTCFERMWLSDRKRIVEAARNWQAAHIVLTVKNIPPGQLATTLNAMTGAFRRLRQRKVWRPVRAGFSFWGLTISAEGEWHPHLHILADVTWLEARDLTANWAACAEAAGLMSRHTNIKRSTGARGGVAGLADEVLRGTKGDYERLVGVFRNGRDDLFIEALDAFRGRPRFRPFGAADAPRREKPARHCPRCGERFRWCDWEKLDAVPVEDYRRYRIDDADWPDFYAGFVRRPEDSEAHGGRPGRAIPGKPEFGMVA